MLFNLALRKIHRHLSANVRLLQFADDILQYYRSEDLNEALSCLEVAYNNLSAWLKTLGLILAPEKMQLCIFDTRLLVISDWIIELEGRIILSFGIILYLGVKLDFKII